MSEPFARNAFDGLFLGVDGGNSKTVAVLADASGRVLGWGRSGCGDIYATTEAAAVDEVVGAVSTALGAAGVDAGSVSAAFCLAGVDFTEDVAYWRDAIAARLPGLRGCSIRNDGFAVLRAGVAGVDSGVGLGVSVGTGAAVVGRGPGGAEWSASMWMTHPAGGSDLGRRAMRAVIRAELGLARATVLSRLLPALHGLPDVATLLHEATRRHSPASMVWHAAAARTVLAAAADGDDVARMIVADQIEALADYVLVAARQVGLDDDGEVPVVIGGSVGQTPMVHAPLIDALAVRLPKARPEVAVRAPVLGAVLQAMADGGAVSGSVLSVLDAASLPPDLLHT